MVRRVVAALAACGVVCAAPGARAGELQLYGGPGAQASTWRGDGAISTAARLGYRMRGLFAIDALTRIGYSTVDSRMLTYVSLGGTLYGNIRDVIRPYVRLALVHQHEEPVSAVRDDPFGAVFGVGNGIRHRGGFGSSLGVDFAVSKRKDVEWVLGADVSGAWFPDPRGPVAYAGGALWAGLNYSL